MSWIFNRSSIRAFALCACMVFTAVQLAGCGSREQRAQDHYQQGLNYLTKNDYVKARLELRNALQLKGDMIEAWRALAKIDEHDRNWQGLGGSLRKIVELDPKDSATQAKLSKLLLLGGAFDDALKLANTATDLDPKNPDFIALKAAILFKQKDVDGALRAAQAALAIDPSNTDANTVVAVAQYSRGDAKGALQTLDNVAAAHKNDVGILALRINILDRSGNTQEAESLLRKLIELNPKEPGFRTQLIRFYIAHKRQDDALHELRAAVEANPDDTNAEFQLVSLLNAVKGQAAARAELVARINAGGRVFPYQIALAKLDFIQGKGSDAIELLQKLIGGANSSDDALAARITLAEMYVGKKEFAAAEPLIADILGADSRNSDGLRLRASIRTDRGRFDDAIADLRSALNDQPRSPLLLANLAVAYERSGLIELADKAFFDATKASGFAPAYGLNYIAFLRRRGLNEHAENVLNDLVSRNPNNTAVLSALAQDKLGHQDWAAAHTLAETIRRLGDNSDLADRISGAAFSGQKKYDQSLAAFQNAYEANPTATQPMAAVVATYLRSKQIDKAESFIQAALVANPHNAEAIVLKGSIQLAKNNPGQAEKDFKRAIDEQPKDVAGYSALANLYAGQKKTDAAINTIQAGLQQDPKNFVLRLNLAGLLESKADYEAAITEYEAMLKDQPGSMIVANNLASLLADHRTDKASLDRANTLATFLKNSGVPQFRDTLGWVAYQRGDYAAASSLLEAAVAELPNVALVQFHLGMTYLATGQQAKASKHFEKAQSLAPNDNELKKKIDAALSGKGKG
jgi:tetratricopeptide (TPR) repeat protein